MRAERQPYKVSSDPPKPGKPKGTPETQPSVRMTDAATDLLRSLREPNAKILKRLKKVSDLNQNKLQKLFRNIIDVANMGVALEERLIIDNVKNVYLKLLMNVCSPFANQIKASSISDHIDSLKAKYIRLRGPQSVEQNVLIKNYLDLIVEAQQVIVELFSCSTKHKKGDVQSFFERLQQDVNSSSRMLAGEKSEGTPFHITSSVGMHLVYFIVKNKAQNLPFSDKVKDLANDIVTIYNKIKTDGTQTVELFNHKDKNNLTELWGKIIKDSVFQAFYIDYISKIGTTVLDAKEYKKCYIEKSAFYLKQIRAYTTLVETAIANLEETLQAGVAICDVENYKKKIDQLKGSTTLRDAKEYINSVGCFLDISTQIALEYRYAEERLHLGKNLVSLKIQIDNLSQKIQKQVEEKGTQSVTVPELEPEPEPKDTRLDYNNVNEITETQEDLTDTGALNDRIASQLTVSDQDFKSVKPFRTFRIKYANGMIGCYKVRTDITLNKLRELATTLWHPGTYDAALKPEDEALDSVLCHWEKHCYSADAPLEEIVCIEDFITLIHQCGQVCSSKPFRMPSCVYKVPVDKQVRYVPSRTLGNDFKYSEERILYAIYTAGKGNNDYLCLTGFIVDPNDPKKRLYLLQQDYKKIQQYLEQDVAKA